MKSVLISIKPQYCELIANGTKTIEIRKNKPKLNTPFKVYIYCTLPPKSEFFWHHDEEGHRTIGEYAHELLKLPDGRVVYDYGMRLTCEEGEYSQDNFLCKKVIGEFICNDITYLGNIATDPWIYLLGSTHEYHKRLVTEKACLTENEMLCYGGQYAWHISDLVIYDKPKELSKFAVVCEGLKPYQCDKCEYSYTESNESVGTYHECCCNNLKPLKRPPQSWCYVEERM